MISVGPVHKYDHEYIVAAIELADFCDLSIDELFPNLAESSEYRLYTERKELAEARKRGYIEIDENSLLEYLMKPEFITVDKYGSMYGVKNGATDIRDGEMGRYYNIPVIFTPHIKQDEAIRKMTAKNNRRAKKQSLASGTYPKPCEAHTNLTRRTVSK